MNYKQYDIFNNFTNTDKAFNLLKQYYYFLITKELKKVNINNIESVIRAIQEETVLGKKGSDLERAISERFGVATS